MIACSIRHKLGIITLVNIWLFFLLSTGNASPQKQGLALLSTKLSQTIWQLYHGNLHQAIDGFKETLKISRANKDKSFEGKSLLWLGVASWDIGRMQDSYNYFNEATYTFNQHGDKLYRDFCYKCRRIVELLIRCNTSRDGRLEHSSLSDIEIGLSLGRELGLPDFELKLLRQKGLVHWYYGELDRFYESSQRSLEIAERINNNDERVKCLNNIGIYYQRKHEYSKALRFYGNALSQISSDDLSTRAECNNNLAILYREMGYLDKALEHLTLALTMDKLKADDNAILIDLENIGSIFLQRGLENERFQDLVQAQNTFFECAGLLEQKKYDPLISLANLNNLGIIKSELRDTISARKFYFKALEIAKKENLVFEECCIINNIASSYYLEDNIDLAIAQYNKGYSLGLRNKIDTIVLESCLGLGQCSEAKNKSQNALMFYNRAADIIEKLMGAISSEYYRAGFAVKRINAYRQIIHILSDGYFKQPSLNLLDEIQGYIDRLRARAFYEGIFEAQHRKEGTNVKGFSEKEGPPSFSIRKVNNDLAALEIGGVERERETNEISDEDEKHQRIALEANPQTKINNSEVPRKGNGLTTIRRTLLDDSTAMLEYIIDDKQSYLLYISSTGSQFLKISGQELIRKLVEDFLIVLKSSKSKSADGVAASTRLIEELLPCAIRSDLNTKDALIVIPDGVLFNLPFEALPSTKNKFSTYLIEDYAISYCPSVSSLFLLKYLQKQKPQPSGLLAIGGIIYEADNKQNIGITEKGDTALLEKTDHNIISYSPLPFSGKEVIDIGSLFPGSQRTILMGEAASESAFKKLSLNDYRFIHFACHGYQDGRYPIRSSLVLTKDGSGDDDGFLQVREIYGLDVRADLVVLSACQTGVGIIERSEGPISLTRSFFYAGARSVISSLWQVNDKSTVLFMKYLYRNLFRGNNTSIALQRAKIKMLRTNYSSPFYWASFILNGDPNATKDGW